MGWAKVSSYKQRRGDIGGWNVYITKRRKVDINLIAVFPLNFPFPFREWEEVK